MEGSKAVLNAAALDNVILTPQEAFARLRRVIDRYMDMGDDDKLKWCLWTMAASTHSSFPTFPYLYLNASKASGKSRLERLTAHLLGGIYTNEPTESILFRTCDPLMIDEAETINRREKASLREVMNAAYKRGMKIRRVRRSNTKEGDAWVVEEFDVYRPMMLANIDGIDDVLEDRCIKIVLDKSWDARITRRLEMFENDPDCEGLRAWFTQKSDTGVTLCRLSAINNILLSLFKHYNFDTSMVTPDTLSNTTTLPTPTNTSDTSSKIIEEIEKSSLIGRDMEVWLSSIIVAAELSMELLHETIKIAENEAKNRWKATSSDNRDVSFIAFISDFIEGREEKGWVMTSDMTSAWTLMNPDDLWFSADWVGKAMIRTGLFRDRRRMARGREFMLDFEKIRRKARLFGVDRDSQKQETLEVKI